MPSESFNGSGSIGCCIAIRDIESGSVFSRMCPSVLDAIRLGIEQLADRTDRTAVIVVGEEDGRIQLEIALPPIASLLSAKLAQPGLFVSLAAQDIVRDRLGIEARFEDFGIHEAEGLERAERLFAVIHPDLAEPELPRRRIEGNCPHLHRSFVGRHRQTDELQELLMHRRVVSVVGPPGVGKSALAIHVARSCADEFTDGIWWFSLDGRASISELLQAIIHDQGFSKLKGPFTIDRVAEALRSKTCMLILDGIETFGGELATLVSTLFSTALNVTILLTSIRPLAIEEEFVYPLAPMSLPKRTDSAEEALNSSEALALFIDRTNQIGRPFEFTEQNIALVTQICQAADGLPSAIELAAAALIHTSLAKLARELIRELPQRERDHGLKVMRDSLQSVLNVSFRGLTSDQKGLIIRLAMFRGAWTEEVAVRFWSQSFPIVEIVRLHMELVAGSWLTFDHDRGVYRMLQPIRNYCCDLAVAGGNNGVLSFVEGCTDLAGRILTAILSPDPGESETTLTRHYADCAFAFKLCLDIPAAGAFTSRLLKALVNFWFLRFIHDDAEELCTLLLASEPNDMDRGRAMVMIGVARLRQRDMGPAREMFEQSLPIIRDLKLPGAEASILLNLAVIQFESLELEASSLAMDDALVRLRETQDNSLILHCLCNAAGIQIRRAQLEPGRRARYLRRAESYLTEAEGLNEAAGAMRKQAYFSACGALALAHGDFSGAEPLLLKAIAVCAEHGLRHEAGEATEGLAEINLAMGQNATAARLLGLASQIRKECGKSRSEFDAQRMGALVSKLRQQFDSERAERLMRYGEKLGLTDVLSPTIFNI